MATMQSAQSFNVLDVHEAPHGGLILRLRLQEGDAPSIRTIRSSNLVAEGPDGESCTLEFDGFAMFGGKPSDSRLSRTGRIDVRVKQIDPAEPKPGLRWTVRLT